jgi:hypothetical protein
VLHHNKLIADMATGSSLAVINDSNALILNAVVIIGRIVLELLLRARDKRKQEKEKIDNEKF